MHQGYIKWQAGHCIGALSSSYDGYLILEAKFQATLDSCQITEILNIWVEVNSIVAVHCIIMGGGPWAI